MVCHLWIFFFRDGAPYCEKDYQVLFGVKCEACHQFITGKVLEVGVLWTRFYEELSHPLCPYTTAENTKILIERLPADFRTKLLIFRVIFSVLVLQSSGKVYDIELIALVSMDLWFLFFSFHGDLQSLLHCLCCVRFHIFTEVIWVLESPLATISLSEVTRWDLHIIWMMLRRWEGEMCWRGKLCVQKWQGRNHLNDLLCWLLFGVLNILIETSQIFLEMSVPISISHGCGKSPLSWNPWTTHGFLCIIIELFKGPKCRGPSSSLRYEKQNLSLVSVGNSA